MASKTLEYMESCGFPKRWVDFDYPNCPIVQQQKERIVDFGNHPQNLLIHGKENSQILACAAMVRFCQVRDGDVLGGHCFAHGEEIRCLLGDSDGASMLLNRYCRSKMLVLANAQHVLVDKRSWNFFRALIHKRWWDDKYTLIAIPSKSYIYETCLFDDYLVDYVEWDTFKMSESKL